MPKYSYDVFAYQERYRKVYEAGATFWEEPIPTDALVNFLHELNPPRGLKAIDMGCGEGRDSVYLARLGLDVSGIDVSRLAVKRAKEYAKNQMVSVNFLVADIRNLPIKDEIFGLIINIACLQMLIRQKARDKHLNEAHKVLKNGGVYFSCNIGVEKPILVEEFYKKLGQEPGNLLARKIKIHGEEKEISLPIIAAWPKSKEQYVEEFERAGFSVVKVYKGDVKPAGDCWVLVARKR